MLKCILILLVMMSVNCATAQSSAHATAAVTIVTSTEVNFLSADNSTLVKELEAETISATRRTSLQSVQLNTLHFKNVELASIKTTDHAQQYELAVPAGLTLKHAHHTVETSLFLQQRTALDGVQHHTVSAIFLKKNIMKGRQLQSEPMQVTIHYN